MLGIHQWYVCSYETGCYDQKCFVKNIRCKCANRIRSVAVLRAVEQHDLADCDGYAPLHVVHGERVGVPQQVRERDPRGVRGHMVLQTRVQHLPHGWTTWVLVCGTCYVYGLLLTFFNLPTDRWKLIDERARYWWQFCRRYS